MTEDKPDSPTSAAATPAEAALFGATLEKFFSSKQITYVLWMLPIAAGLALAGTAYLGFQTYTIGQQIVAAGQQAEAIATRELGRLKDDFERERQRVKESVDTQIGALSRLQTAMERDAAAAAAARESAEGTAKRFREEWALLRKDAIDSVIAIIREDLVTKTSDLRTEIANLESTARQNLVAIGDQLRQLRQDTDGDAAARQDLHVRIEQLAAQLPALEASAGEMERESQRLEDAVAKVNGFEATTSEDARATASARSVAEAGVGAVKEVSNALAERMRGDLEALSTLAQNLGQQRAVADQAAAVLTTLRLDELKQKRDGADAELESARTQADALRDRVAELEGGLLREDLETKTSDLRTEIATLESSARQNLVAIGDQLRQLRQDTDGDAAARQDLHVRIEQLAAQLPALEASAGEMERESQRLEDAVAKVNGFEATTAEDARATASARSVAEADVGAVKEVSNALVERMRGDLEAHSTLAQNLGQQRAVADQAAAALTTLRLDELKQKRDGADAELESARTQADGLRDRVAELEQTLATQADDVMQIETATAMALEASRKASTLSVEI